MKQVLSHPKARRDELRDAANELYEEAEVNDLTCWRKEAADYLEMRAAAIYIPTKCGAVDEATWAECTEERGHGGGHHDKRKGQIWMR